MNIIVIILFAYMIDGGTKERYHKCEFPHSWDKKIEHIIDTGLPETHFT